MNVEVETVLAFIGFENVAVTAVFGDTPLALAAGDIPVTVSDVEVPKVAVNVVFAAPIVTLCDCAPPSDHETKERPLPAAGFADIVVLCPTIEVVVSGAVPDKPPYTTCWPVGDVATVTCTVCGWIETDAVPVWFALSVTVKTSSK